MTDKNEHKQRVEKIIKEGNVTEFLKHINIDDLLKNYPTTTIIDYMIGFIKDLENVNNNGTTIRTEFRMRKALSLFEVLSIMKPPMMNNEAIANRIVNSAKRNIAENSSILTMRDDITGILNDYFPDNETSDFPEKIEGIFEKYQSGITVPHERKLTAGDIVIHKKSGHRFIVSSVGLLNNHIIYNLATIDDDGILSTEIDSIFSKTMHTEYELEFVAKVPKPNEVYVTRSHLAEKVHINILKMSKSKVYYEILGSNLNEPIHCDLLGFNLTYAQVLVYVDEIYENTRFAKARIIKIVCTSDFKILIVFKDENDHITYRTTLATFITTFTKVKDAELN